MRTSRGPAWMSFEVNTLFLLTIDVEVILGLLLLLVWVVTQLLSGVASLTASTSVAWWAHLGGFVTGLAIAVLARPRRLRHKK